MAICLPVLFLILQYMHGIKTKKWCLDIPKDKWVMGLLSTLGVREFEPKCSEPDETFWITFYCTVNLF